MSEKKYVIKYQETAVEATKSVQEITDLVRKYGGRRFEQVWDEAGRVTGIRFALAHPEIGELPISMTARTGEIERILEGAGLWRSYAEQDRRGRIERPGPRARRGVDGRSQAIRSDRASPSGGGVVTNAPDSARLAEQSEHEEE